MGSVEMPPGTGLRQSQCLKAICVRCGLCELPSTAIGLDGQALQLHQPVKDCLSLPGIPAAEYRFGFRPNSNRPLRRGAGYSPDGDQRSIEIRSCRSTGTCLWITASSDRYPSAR